MKYTIFNLDDRREKYTNRINDELRDKDWQYLSTRKVNGSIPHILNKEIEDHGYEINWPSAKVGQLGIWYTVLNSFSIAPHVTFEDDAILSMMFDWRFRRRLVQLPDDADFFSLFLPRDSDHLYTPKHGVSHFLCKTYQRYGGVSMYYTKQGVEKIRKLLERDGLTGQYDDVLYEYSKSGELNGYTSKPRFPDLVYITGTEESIVQDTEPFYA